MCALLCLYARHGGESPRSIFAWLAAQWGKDFSLNWAMPLFAAYAVYAKRHELAAAPKSPSVTGAFIVALSLTLHVLAYRTHLPSVSILTVVGAVWGSCYALWGWRVARLLLFPTGYTLLCFGNHLLIHAVPALRSMASAASWWTLNGFGMEVVREGTFLHSHAGQGFAFDIADACSGFRSVLTLTTIAPLYAFLYMRGTRRKWALCLLAAPIAVLTNICRIITVMAVARRAGMEMAMILWHDFAGIVVFFATALLLEKTEGLIMSDWRAKLTAFRKRPPKPP